MVGRCVGTALLLATASAVHVNRLGGTPPVAKQEYTTNPACTKNNCVNPIFPGLEDLYLQGTKTWTCAPLTSVHNLLGFCKSAVDYDVALPVPQNISQGTLLAKVQAQDKAAVTTFMYHMAGIGREGWEFPNPAKSNDDCVQSIWRLACYTYFPRAKAGCSEGATTEYIKPCQSSCNNYVQACKVQCCDESVQCVFTHKKVIDKNTAIVTQGYAPYDGPSTMCTGFASRSRSPQALLLALVMMVPAMLTGTSQKATLLVGLAAAAFTLQGMDAKATPTMADLMAAKAMQEKMAAQVGQWRAQPDYLIRHEFVPPGKTANDAIINSCTMTSLAPEKQCSGHGVCKSWDAHAVESPAFCVCERDWAGPECTETRKSQTKAFLLSIFLGGFGADQFYLGFQSEGIMKAGLVMFALVYSAMEFALFGSVPFSVKDISEPFGLVKMVATMAVVMWYVNDIIEAGSGAPQADSFRTAADLPHWVFALTTVCVAVSLGFVWAYFTVNDKISLRKMAGLRALNPEVKALTGPGPLYGAVGGSSAFTGY